MKIGQLITIGLLVICMATGVIVARAQDEPERPSTNQDVIKLLNEKKLTAEELKTKIGNVPSRFDLSAAGLKQLQDAGVDASIVAAMIQSPRFKGDWYVADLYEYLDSIQLSGTNYVPSLFNPLFPGIVYLVLLALLWLGVLWWADAKRRPRLPRLIVAIVLLLFVSGVLTGSTNLLKGSYHAISVAEIDVAYLKKSISPNQDPCAQVLRRQTLTATRVSAQSGISVPAHNAGVAITEPGILSPQATPTGVREAGNPSSIPGSRAPFDSTLNCRQPDTSPTPEPVAVGKMIAADGSTGDVYLDKRASRYLLTVANLSRAGKYTGLVSSDVIAPVAMTVTLNVSDWWPYFFVAVALGVIFSNYSFRPRTLASLPHGEKSGAHRETAEAFIQGVNSTTVSTVSALVAVVLGLYSNYSASWGLPVDYVTAFLGGAAITLGLRTLAGAANAASTRIERALKKEPPHFVNEIHLPAPLKRD